MDQTAEAHWERATALWYEGRAKQACAQFAKAVAALPPDAPLSFVLEVKTGYANCLREVGDVDQALALYPQLHALCVQGNLDQVTVVRQWAIAHELKGDIAQARALYETIVPDDTTSQLDRLKWHHAFGLLNWSAGHLSEAMENLSAATAALPDDDTEAAHYLPVLGNDARMSLYLGNEARAWRLVSRMIEIRKSVPTVPLVGETTLAVSRAALARHNKDYNTEAAILKECLGWQERNDPDEWMHKLDMAGNYAAALQRAGRQEEGIAYLQKLCDAAPFDMAWVGTLMLAQMQVKAGDRDGATQSAQVLLATVVGMGPVAREVELMAIFASLANLAGQGDAAVFLGKLTLKYLGLVTHGLEKDALHGVIEESALLLDTTVGHLRRAGRFHEVAVLQDLFARIRRYVLLLHRSGTEALAFQPVPFDRAELQAEEAWLQWREELAHLRKSADRDTVLQRAGAILQGLLNFTTSSGLTRRHALLPPPAHGALRLALLPAGDHCVVQYCWPDRMESRKIPVSPQAFLDQVADLRTAVSDPDAWRGPATSLYGLIIAPIAAHLDGIDRLEVDASGALGHLPFALLTDGAACLTERVTIINVLNVDPLAPTATPRAGLAHLTAFRSGPLTKTPAPLQNGSELFLPTMLAVGPDMTRARLLDILQTRPACLSLATHFEIAHAQPDLSMLEMGDGTSLYLADLAGDHFDLAGMDAVLFATCSSGVDDASDAGHASLAALILEKGAQHFIGTLWDISETAAATITEAFWQAFAADPAQGPAGALASLQARHAARAMSPKGPASRTGGIGSSGSDLLPEDWAAFAVFENCNFRQQTTAKG